MVALPAGRGEGNVIVGATGGVDLCPCLQQQLCHLRERWRGREKDRERKREVERERGEE